MGLEGNLSCAGAVVAKARTKADMIKARRRFMAPSPSILSASCPAQAGFVGWVEPSGLCLRQAQGQAPRNPPFVTSLQSVGYAPSALNHPTSSACADDDAVRVDV